MTKPVLAFVLCSAFELLGPSTGAVAGTRRYACTITAADREPVGVRNERAILTVQYGCRIADGLLSDAGITAVSVSEWAADKGTYLASLEFHRALEGVAIGQLSEATGFSSMEGEQGVAVATSGTAVFKFASGSLAALSGKTLKFTTKLTGLRSFELEFTDWPESLLWK
ncbi:hypothetical protein FXV83_16965 [Bradyrhizobium hipponense]|uniref:Uncharacterized protein n=1 Tax=Bradyrhizobium hipponense TaxID=2605638 RepID=A0A5S4YN10_9BRAD|nr:hypothetical protein [Bradyrhizobium sp. CSA207]TYO65383.1 hypothetical protein FXV83_16965 [Bradyrhizobium hipponense]